MEKKINILHWPTAYPDPSRGMPYHCIFVEEHIKSLAKYTNNRVVFFSSETTLKNSLHERVDTIENEVTVTRFYFNQKLNRNFLNLYMRLVALIYFIKLIYFEKYKPDILHYHFHQVATSSKFLTKIFKLKYVVTEHWSAFLGWPNIGEKRYKNAAKVFNYATRILPVSLKIQKGITTYTGAVIDYKSIVIPNAVNTEVFKYENKLQTKKDYKNLIFVGRNAEEKDIPTLLEGVALIKQQGIKCKLHLVGDGDYYNIKELINKHQLQDEVDLHGQQDKLAINKLLNQSDLLLLTSTIENSPCVIGEAHCCGVPVIASNVGGISELIMEGDMFEPKNPKQLSEKIIELLNKPINKEQLSRVAAQKFGYESVGQQLYQIYTEVCAE